MGSRQDLVTYVVEQLGPRARSKAMFGEYGIYRDETLIALFCDDRLYLKRSEAGRALLGDDVEEAPPYPGAKPLYVVQEERWDDADFMRSIADATARELMKAPAKKKASAKKRTKNATPKKVTARRKRTTPGASR
jgi:TfoX/Sxy family transcriptional regulator of competence genes